MKPAARLSLLALAIGLCLLIAILFLSDLFAYFIRPAAVVLWMLWQILLSIDQHVLWGLLVFSCVSYAVYRILRIPADSARQAPPPHAGSTLDRVRYWRTSIQYTADEIDAPNILKRDLAQLLVSLHAASQPEASRPDIYKALRQGRIALPEHIHAFLFPVEPDTTQRSAGQVLQNIWQTPDRWTRRWTGRDAAVYHRSIEEVLTLIESALEIDHDDERFDSPDH